jgi:hypothetical protein
MTRERASELHQQVMRDMSDFLQSRMISNTYVDLGRDYLPAVAGMELLLSSANIAFAQGRIGERLSLLRNWLLSGFQAFSDATSENNREHTA